MALVERFLKYVSFETTSDPSSETVPSTSTQLVLAKLLAEQMNEIGLVNVEVSKYGYVYGTLPSNLDKEVDNIGFIAHMDTSPDFNGKDAKPRIIENYDGKDIVLSEGIVTKVDELTELKRFEGKDLIVTDGHSLLGADDKAGIAEILEAMDFYVKNPDVKHGTIQVAFTPDEEIGRGADYFDVERFNAKYAFTVDGGAVNEINYETFNASEANITVNGLSIHPGTAKNTMINSLNIAMEYHNLLPVCKRPEHTEGLEGFYHLVSMQGGCEKTELYYIVRNHDSDEFERQQLQLQRNAEYINEKYGRNLIEVNITETYRNMKEILIDCPEIIDTLKSAVEMLGLEPVFVPVRGGTDGSRLTFMGLPCPNIGTGGAFYHGKHEVCCIQEMHMVVELIKNIVQLVSED